jgi:hypothetical protein
MEIDTLFAPELQPKMIVSITFRRFCLKVGFYYFGTKSFSSFSHMDINFLQTGKALFEQTSSVAEKKYKIEEATVVEHPAGELATSAE